MRPIISLVFAAAVTLSAGTAIAACPDKSAATPDTTNTAGISKDGTHAPLEAPDPAKGANQPVAKDGNTMPLAGQEGGGNKDLATSQQDIEAQQKGEKTASAKANDCND
jgi:hypothetical protein